MAVKKGYKQTEVGVIPEEWDEVRFSALEPFITSGSRGWARYYSDRGELFIRITNMSRATIYLDLDDPRFVKLPTTSHEGARTCVQEGDILISVTADIGIISLVSPIVPKPAYINQHIALIRFPLRRVDSKFAAYYLASSSPQKRFRAITDQGAKAGINLATVRDIPLAVPPTLTEQEAIAGALSDADAWIESLEQLIAKKRQIKQGA
ncbi:MAG: restriction endonuclease subunit S, partial [Planctomycetes bacterium]|nr:restriction endonuclease subunit S [Planctomycetota bacterium]